jgi:GNAT superfamily N-acetyltransferase
VEDGMEMDALSARVEEICLNAWPALKEIFYDGWLIRLAEGQTRRTNSVNVIGAGRYALAEKIAYCERVYRAHGLPPHFRIRSIDDPALERMLDAQGFRAEGETRTLYMDFAKNPPPAPDPRAQIMPGRPTAAWLRAHEKYSGQPAAKDDIRKRLLDLVALPVAFACMRDARGLIVSVAYGAVHDRLVSLQWVATDPAQRRQGLSRAKLSGLLHWAQSSMGATGACLQVVADNAPAVRLYQGVGFDRELYTYHYRVR